MVLNKQHFLISFVLWVVFIVALISFVTGSSYVQDNVIAMAWEEAPNDVRVAVQETFQCCGFANEDDQPGDPCPSDGLAGCESVVMDTLGMSFVEVIAINAVIILDLVSVMTMIINMPRRCCSSSTLSYGQRLRRHKRANNEVRE